MSTSDNARDNSAQPQRAAPTPVDTSPVALSRFRARPSIVGDLAKSPLFQKWKSFASLLALSHSAGGRKFILGCPADPSGYFNWSGLSDALWQGRPDLPGQPACSLLTLHGPTCCPADGPREVIPQEVSQLERPAYFGCCWGDLLCLALEADLIVADDGPVALLAGSLGVATVALMTDLRRRHLYEDHFPNVTPVSILRTAADAIDPSHTTQRVARLVGVLLRRDEPDDLARWMPGDGSAESSITKI